MSNKTYIIRASRQGVLWIASIIGLLYVALVLFPSYVSGLYATPVTVIADSDFSVPIYSNSGSVNDSFVSNIPIFLTLMAWYFVPILFIGVIILSIIEYKNVRLKQIFWWSSLFVLFLCFVYVTLPVANALLVYVVD